IHQANHRSSTSRCPMKPRSSLRWHHGRRHWRENVGARCTESGGESSPTGHGTAINLGLAPAGAAGRAGLRILRRGPPGGLTLHKLHYLPCFRERGADVSHSRPNPEGWEMLPPSIALIELRTPGVCRQKLAEERFDPRLKHHRAARQGQVAPPALSYSVTCASRLRSARVFRRGAQCTATRLGNSRPREIEFGMPTCTFGADIWRQPSAKAWG